MKVRFLALAMLLSLGLPLVAQSAAPPIIAVRLASATELMGFSPHQLADSTFHVRDSVVISDRDIERADTSWASSAGCGRKRPGVRANGA